MTNRPALTAQRLRELFHYNPETGAFTRRVSRGSALAGSKAGSPDGYGYRRITIDYGEYRTNRLAVLYMTGEWPKGEVDHENRRKYDDRWVNLRDATVSQNRSNRGRQLNNKSGYKGVRLHSHGHAWEANITVNGRFHYLGLFDSPEAAHAAYEAAARERFGVFARPR